MASIALCFASLVVSLLALLSNAGEIDDLLSPAKIAEMLEEKTPEGLTADQLNEVLIRINECLLRLPGDDKIELCRSMRGVLLLLQEGANHKEIGNSIADCMLAAVKLESSQIAELTNSMKCLREIMVKPFSFDDKLVTPSKKLPIQ